MHTLSFFAGVVPVSLLICIFCLGVIAFSVPNYDLVSNYVVYVFLCQFTVMCLRIACVIRKTARLHSRKNTKLPETPASDFEDKFAVHIIEELTKLVFLSIAAFFFAKDRRSMASYAFFASGVLVCNKLVAIFYTFSPVECDRHYNKFYDSLVTFENRVFCGSDKSSVKSESTSLTSEQSTLVSQSSDENMELTFRLDFFDSSAAAPQCIPIAGSREHDEASNSQMVERLYSVSPRDTLYLDYKHAHEAMDTSVSFSNVHFDTDVSLSKSFKQAFDMAHIDSCSQVPGLNGSMEKGQMSQTTSSASTNTTNYQPSPDRFENDSWWAWLFPWCNKQTRDSKISRKIETTLLRKKLSTYTLNSDTLSVHEKNETTSLRSTWSRASYGSIDLENQAFFASTRVSNSHAFYEYARFANKYLDFWSPSLAGMMRCIDPAFIKFGVPIPRLSAFSLILYGASTCMWQISSTLIFAMPFIGSHGFCLNNIFAFACLFILKLFCVNFLHGQWSRSYQACIAAEFLMNVVLFTFASLWYHISA